MWVMCLLLDRSTKDRSIDRSTGPPHMPAPSATRSGGGACRRRVSTPHWRSRATRRRPHVPALKGVSSRVWARGRKDRRLDLWDPRYFCLGLDDRSKATDAPSIGSRLDPVCVLELSRRCGCVRCVKSMAGALCVKGAPVGWPMQLKAVWRKIGPVGCALDSLLLLVSASFFVRVCVRHHPSRLLVCLLV